MRGGSTAHEALYWELMQGKFIREDHFSTFSNEVSRVVNNMMHTMSNEDIKQILDDFFGIMTSTGAVTLTDLARQTAGQRLYLFKQLSECESIKKFGKDLSDVLLGDKTLFSRLLKRGIPENSTDKKAD